MLIYMYDIVHVCKAAYVHTCNNLHVILHCICIFREYEARIAELKEQFGQEQADKTKLELELERLQKEWDEQLQSLQTQVGYV